MTLYIIFGIIILVLVGLVAFLFLRLQNSGNNAEEIEKKFAEQFRYLRDEIRETGRDIDTKMREQNRDMQHNVRTTNAESQKLIKEITEKLTEVKETNKQVFEMTDQLSNLEKVLTNQKQRGNWGEGALDLILSNVLSGHYALQHKFSNGDMVDAVIFVKDKFLPIDSKFSMNNYQRCIDADNDEDRKTYANLFKDDLKKRIQETAKYIKTEENTLPLAFMFIPSEAIYYDLLAGENSRLKINTQKLMEFAQSEKVFIVSPTSIYAYLNLVLAGVKAFKIEENSKEIQKKVEELGKHIFAYDEYMKKLGNSLSTTVNHYNTASKELKKIDKDVYKITGGDAGGKIEVLAIDKPSAEE
jgi:DNA recombination protein RmuC